MTISDLTKEQKEELSLKHQELDKVVKQKETLDEKMIPLCDKLSELEEEEKNLNSEYENIINNKKETFSSKQTSRLSEITNRNVQIGIEKYNIKQKISTISNDFFEVREKSKNIEFEIDKIINGRKQGSIFSEKDDVVNLDKNGNIIVVTNNNYKSIKKELKINEVKNVLTKSNEDVIDFIIDKFSSVGTISFSLSEKTKIKVNSFLNKIKEVQKIIKEGYAEEQQRVEEIIDNYNQIKENKKKIEEEADKLTLSQNTEVSKEIEDNLYYSSQNEQPDIIKQDEKIDTIENVAYVVDNNEESDISIENSKQNQNIYLDIFNEQKVKEEKDEIEIDIQYKNINKQAHTIKDKMPEIIRQFSKRGNNLLNIKSKKTKEIENLEKYKQELENINNKNDSNLNEIENIFGMGA